MLLSDVLCEVFVRNILLYSFLFNIEILTYFTFFNNFSCLLIVELFYIKYEYSNNNYFLYINNFIYFYLI